MALITASGSERAVKCNASLSLPRVYTTSASAERGTELHEFIATSLLRGRDAALAECAEEYRAECTAIDMAAVQEAIGPFDSLFVELAMSANLKTGKGEILGENIKRAYPHTDDPMEVYGTGDLLAFKSSVLSVLDVKTGRKVKPAGQNPQLLTLATLARAAFAAQDLKPSAYRLGILYIGEDGEVYLDQAVVDDMELDGWAHELRGAVQGAIRAQAKVDRGQVPNVSTGDHCRYCPAFNACPAKQSLALDLARNAGVFKPGAGNLELNPQQAGEVYAKAKDAVEWLETIMSAIKERAQHEPIPLPSGATLREVSGAESIDYNLAFPVLMQYGADIAANAAEAKITKASLKRALNGKHGEALDKLRAAGAITNGKPSVREVK